MSHAGLVAQSEDMPPYAVLCLGFRIYACSYIVIVLMFTVLMNALSYVRNFVCIAYYYHRKTFLDKQKKDSQ